ncbi:arabinan endo-1,5-alpha-L-arabinosidase [Glaciihabitans arcticus]|uniref:Arabinan endo-1,5-alpha-L-arabinosidase n=1 Tax=Glaciihabitans arcticus TaxID=2668039 RepID=A0A4Q9GY60_9MICO|nr:family 43 glycosylhydrolase [Glaciihabitans arcticus]TBN57220.1 arabinan endo-1,5-alpha-L-arabinosidase [Glaciihabitans arcticus]
MPISRTLVSVAVVLATALAMPMAASAAPSAPPRKPASYTNPLDVTLANGAPAANCADPDVLRGPGKKQVTWYLYCTSDVIDESEVDGSGDPVFHNIPMYTSTDLIEWSYVGDAFPIKPSWIPATGGVWAPEVVFRDGTYFLYYAAPETNVGGSTIGVATSSSPTGPWIDSGAPVLTPTNDRWQFDPEVLTANGKTYLYFGSYFGGLFVRELTADGLTSLPATETRIAVDNRYEGTVIVKHKGWYYFMGSATNCCAGPLTGYSVFAARSRSPFGPFVDQDGVSLLAGRVGGTPVLSQNGNRWVGPGHNTVFTDFSGQDWTIYHAVDQRDPYVEGQTGYTKRPVLLDPLDWKNGWPVVRGNKGPSDERVAGPAAQPGQRSAYKPRFAKDVRVGRAFADLSDTFSQPELSDQWSWVRPDAASTVLANGTLNWQTQAADLHPPAEPLTSVLTEPAPRGDYVVETSVRVTTPAEGCCQNYVQGGLVIYGDDGNYVKLSSASIWNTRQTEFGKNVSPAPAGYPSYGNAVVGPVGEWTYLRIVARDDVYTAYTSLDGRTWRGGTTWTHDLGAGPRIGLISLGGAGFESQFDYVKVSRLK